MTLRLSEVAARDLENMYDFIARDNPDAALQTLESIYYVLERLESFPYLGRSAQSGTRDLVKAPFVIVYRIRGDVISIEAVFHGSRKYD